MTRARAVEATLVRLDGEILHVRVPWPAPPTFTLARFPYANLVFDLKSNRATDATGETVCYLQRRSVQNDTFVVSARTLPLHHAVR
jgi:hypothetical protein